VRTQALVTHALCVRSHAGLFEYDASTRQHWISRAALPSGVSDGEFFLAGVVLGLAIYNSTLLDVHFPQVRLGLGEKR
jgi:hypothetical protein